MELLILSFNSNHSSFEKPENFNPIILLSPFINNDKCFDIFITVDNFSSLSLKYILAFPLSMSKLASLVITLSLLK